jgi:hypothetical protein
MPNLVPLLDRTARATAAAVDGLVHEAMEVLRPGWLRRARLCQAIAGALQ